MLLQRQPTKSACSDLNITMNSQNNICFYLVNVMLLCANVAQNIQVSLHFHLQKSKSLQHVWKIMKRAIKGKCDL